MSSIRRYRGSTLTVGFVVLLGAIVYSAADFTSQARFFPWAIGIPALILTMVQLVMEVIRANRPEGQSDEEDEGIVDLAVDRDIPTDVVVGRGSNIALWMLGYFVGILLFGFNIASPLFVLLFLVFQAKARPRIVILCFFLVLGLQIGVFHNVLRVTWLEAIVPGPQNFILELLGS